MNRRRDYDRHADYDRYEYPPARNQPAHLADPFEALEGRYAIQSTEIQIKNEEITKKDGIIRDLKRKLEAASAEAARLDEMIARIYDVLHNTPVRVLR